jgi:CRISPR-associated protein Csh2
MSDNTIKNRSEILFIYDVKDANPNGDPIDENKPRIDEETGINYVTDVRLKRTVRDYLNGYKNLKIFIQEIKDEHGKLKTKEDRLSDFENDPKSLIEQCIDIKLFGATTAVEDKTMALTGPVQFKYGKSLHRVDLTYIKGTTVMPSKADKKQGTFTEKYILPYSLIAFYGIVNENAAIKQNIPLTNNDLKFLLEGIWNGTKHLISGSKFGQVPRFLIHVIYKDNFFIGELDKFISIKTEKNDEAIRDISDVKIDITNLINKIEKHKEKVEKIQYIVDDRASFVKDENIVNINDIKIDNITFETLNFS